MMYRFEVILQSNINIIFIYSYCIPSGWDNKFYMCAITHPGMHNTLNCLIQEINKYIFFNF